MGCIRYLAGWMLALAGMTILGLALGGVFMSGSFGPSELPVMIGAVCVAGIIGVLCLLLARSLHRSSGEEEPERPAKRGARVNYDWRNFTCFVRGTNHRNADGTPRKKVIRGCCVGDELRLVPEPGNTFDPNAVKVCRTDGQQVGYLPAETAAWMSRAIADGVKYQVVIRDMRYSREYGRGVNVHVVAVGHGWVSQVRLRFGCVALQRIAGYA